MHCVIRFLTRKRPTRFRRVITTVFAGQSLKWNWELSDSELKLISRPLGSSKGVRSYAFPYELFGGFGAFVVNSEGRLSNGTLTTPSSPCPLGWRWRAVWS